MTELLLETLTDEVIRATVIAAALGLLCGVVIVALVFISRAIADTAASCRRIHQQQANIIEMLLRAGFRPARGRADWSDDAHETRVKGQYDDTQFDWRTPG